MSIENFKVQIKEEIQAAINDPSSFKKSLINHLIKLEMASSLEEIITFLKEIGHPEHVQIAATSLAIHELILENPDRFIALFSRDNQRAIIHQACKMGNLNLVKCLIEKMNLDITKEKVASPFTSYTTMKDRTYQFHDPIPVVQAAAESNSLELMQYLLSFYDLKQIDNTALTGDLQSALVVAARNNRFDIVKQLLECGVNVNSEVKEGPYDYSPTMALQAAMRSNGGFALIELLVNRGAKITRLNQSQAVCRGRVDIVELFVAKGISFKQSVGDDYLLEAFQSKSKAMVNYFLNTLKFHLYHSEDPTEERKQYWGTQIALKVLKSGSIEMLRFIEDELHIPVTELMKAELETIRDFRNGYSDKLMLEAVCSYNVELLKYLFETKELMPSKQQLAQLEGYAYNTGRCLPQHQQFVTHAYVYSFLHANPEMQALLYKISGTNSLEALSSEELFVLYADYTKNFQERPERFAHGILFRDNSIHLANEIAKRHLPKETLIELASQNERKLAADIFYFFLVSGNGYSDEEVIDLVKDNNFDANCRFDAGNRPLHCVIHYQRKQLIAPLLAKGALPDEMNEQNNTALLMVSPEDNVNFSNLLGHAHSLKNSLDRCMKIENSPHLIPLLKSIEGNLGNINIVDWLKLGKRSPENLYNALCHINDAVFARAKQQILASEDPVLIQALKFAEHFKTTGQEPPEFAKRRGERFSALVFNSLFGGGCCGFRGLGLALLAAQSEDDAEAADIEVPDSDNLDIEISAPSL